MLSEHRGGESDEDSERKSKDLRSRSRDRSISRGRGENIHWSEKSLEEMAERDWRIFREDHDIIIKGGRVPNPLRSWKEHILPEYVYKPIAEEGFQNPTPIQMQAIPIGLECRDMIGLAPTGSGKSVSFLIPLIVHLSQLPPSQEGPYSIILAPSRELAQQIHEEFKKFAKYTHLKAACIVGGKSSEEQASTLGVGVEVIIGTPGRLQDIIERQFTSLSSCKYVIIDEADKMIKDGFEDNLKFLLDSISDNQLEGVINKRTTLMFSATMNSSLEKLARKYLTNPSYISIGEPGAGKKQIEQQIVFLDENEKRSKLRSILDKTKPPIIVFVNQKNNIDSLCKFLEKNRFIVSSYHGGKSQEQREKALYSFKKGRSDILVCTSLGSRGLDVDNITLVVNYDCPFTIEDYTHRIGRTGRAEMTGKSITFITKSDEQMFYDLKEYLEKNKQHVPRELDEHPASKFKPGRNEEKHRSNKHQVVYKD
jgi:ATP-dependent RNA helicase DDX23/PRP28